MSSAINRWIVDWLFSGARACLKVATALALILVGCTMIARAGGDSLSFEDRVRCQRAVEEVYWRHRIWPAANPGPKPALDEVLPDAMLRQRYACFQAASVPRWSCSTVICAGRNTTC